VNALQNPRVYRALALALVLAFTGGIFPLAAQTAGEDAEVPKIEYPQWSRDLRRAEIVAFGTIPFTWLVSTVIMDVSRTIAHNGDERYLPWPLKPAGAPAMTDGEFVSAIGLAAGISLTAALVDHIIIKHKRKKAERDKLLHPPRQPEIIRMPITEFTGETSGENVEAGTLNQGAR
jgi:hypothetical protein